MDKAPSIINCSEQLTMTTAITSEGEEEEEEEEEEEVIKMTMLTTTMMAATTTRRKKNKMSTTTRSFQTFLDVRSCYIPLSFYASFMSSPAALDCKNCFRDTGPSQLL